MIKDFREFLGGGGDDKFSPAEELKVELPEVSRGDIVIGYKGKFKEEEGIVLRVEDNQIVVKLARSNKKVWVSPKNFKATGERRELPKP